MILQRYDRLGVPGSNRTASIDATRVETDPSKYEPWRYRVLGTIIPDLDDVVERGSLPRPANPILPLNLQPGLLAGVAIVERAGSEMLEMLQGQMMGQHQSRFSIAIEEIITHQSRSMLSSQGQLI